MEIYIVSRSRQHRQITIHNLSEKLWESTTIVVPQEQYNDYRSAVPKEIKIMPFDGEGIHAKREFILTLQRTGKIVILDDDLKFYKRTEEGTKYPIMFQHQSDEMFAVLNDMLDGYVMVGFTDKFMSQNKPRGYVECQRFNQILGINRDLLPEPWPQFRVHHDEEHDFHLQLLTRGCRTAVITEWTKSDKPRAPGGCNDWRTEEVIAKAHVKLQELWPDIVTISQDPPRARYNWQRAKQLGGL